MSDASFVKLFLGGPFDDLGGTASIDEHPMQVLVYRWDPKTEGYVVKPYRPIETPKVEEK